MCVGRAGFRYPQLPGNIRGDTENVNGDNRHFCFLIRFKSPSKSVVENAVICY